MRVSSAIVPCSSGTLKSTRMKTRLPLISRSSIESLAITPRPAASLTPCERSSPACLSGTHYNLLSYKHAQQIDAPVRITPFVVVPRQHLHEIAVHHLRVRRVHDRGIRVALEIDR